MRSKGIEIALRSGCLGVEMGKRILLTLATLVALPSSRESSQPRDRTCIFYATCISRQILYQLGKEPPGKPLKAILKTPVAPGSLLEMWYFRPCGMQDNGPSKMSSSNPQNLWRSCFTWQRGFCWLTQGDDSGLAGWAQYNHTIIQIPSVFKTCFDVGHLKSIYWIYIASVLCFSFLALRHACGS